MHADLHGATSCVIKNPTGTSSRGDVVTDKELSGVLGEPVGVHKVERSTSVHGIRWAQRLSSLEVSLERNGEEGANGERQPSVNLLLQGRHQGLSIRGPACESLSVLIVPKAPPRSRLVGHCRAWGGFLLVAP